MKRNGRTLSIPWDETRLWPNGPCARNDMALGDLNSVDVGERLRSARETAGITQAYAAESIDVARTTLIAVEKGQRRIRQEQR